MSVFKVSGREIPSGPFVAVRPAFDLMAPQPSVTPQPASSARLVPRSIYYRRLPWSPNDRNSGISDSHHGDFMNPRFIAGGNSGGIVRFHLPTSFGQ
jgi:hypothetical protein